MSASPVAPRRVESDRVSCREDNRSAGPNFSSRVRRVGPRGGGRRRVLGETRRRTARTRDCREAAPHVSRSAASGGPSQCSSSCLRAFVAYPSCPDNLPARSDLARSRGSPSEQELKLPGPFDLCSRAIYLISNTYNRAAPDAPSSVCTVPRVMNETRGFSSANDTTTASCTCR
jgi:hypothetical protein